ncbi:MAG: hypothetical protein GXO75_07720 [Calditrichaeota bacterium]|nr:hypothetical protein [Calditrichota bacterium]
MYELETFKITFPGNRQALTLRAGVDCDPAELVSALKLPKAEGVILLVGGAGFASPEALKRMSAFFDALAEVLVRRNITVIDGGTNAGVMALMGRALAEKGRRAPHIGVLPAKAQVDESGLLAEEIPEPHHSHFVLINSNQWGDETMVMNSLAHLIAGNAPVLVFLVNGGQIALKEIELSIHKGYDIIIVRGSGRLADEIAEQVMHPASNRREIINKIAEKGKFTLVPLSASLEEIENVFSQKLRG